MGALLVLVGCALVILPIIWVSTLYSITLRDSETVSREESCFLGIHQSFSPPFFLGCSLGFYSAFGNGMGHDCLLFRVSFFFSSARFKLDKLSSVHLQAYNCHRSLYRHVYFVSPNS